MSATILVTGGAGYIGAHTCRALAAAGFHPVVYDSLLTGHAESVRWGPLEVGDILDRDRLNEVMAAHKPDAIIHFAASAYVGESVTNPLKYYHNNVAGSVALVERAVDNGLTRFVFSSSCATFGVHGEQPIAANATQDPINPYGRTKLIVEQLLRDTAAAHTFNAVALRYFNAGGVSLDGELGEEHDPETHIIPLALKASRDQDKPLSILWTDYDTPDGTCVRDFIHVEDLADAHVAALRLLIADKVDGFEGLNLGTGTGFSVREIVREVQRLTNRSVPVREAPRRPGDPAVLVADPGAAQERLGWAATRSDIETIIGSAWTWFGNARSHKKGKAA